MGRKNHYDSLDDLYNDLDNESFLDDGSDILDDDDLAILNSAKSTPAEKPKKKRGRPPKAPGVPATTKTKPRKGK